ncbi:hypothetical protein VTN02DRAFT_3198 [Thermoascus thermophilus]
MSHFQVEGQLFASTFSTPLSSGRQAISSLGAWAVLTAAVRNPPCFDNGQSDASHLLGDMALATSRGLEPCQRSILNHAATVPESIGSLLAQRNGMPLLLHRGAHSGSPRQPTLQTPEIREPAWRAATALRGLRDLDKPDARCASHSALAALSLVTQTQHSGTL